MIQHKNVILEFSDVNSICVCGGALPNQAEIRPFVKKPYKSLAKEAVLDKQKYIDRIIRGVVRHCH